VPADAVAIAEVVARGVDSTVCGTDEGEQAFGNRTVTHNMSSVGGVG